MPLCNIVVQPVRHCNVIAKWTLPPNKSTPQEGVEWDVWSKPTTWRGQGRHAVAA